EFASRANVTDIKKELEKLKSDIATEEKALSGPRGKLADAEAQIKKKERDIEELKNRPNEEGQASLQKKIKEIEPKSTQEQAKLDGSKASLDEKEGDLKIERKLLMSNATTVEKVRKLEFEVIKLDKEVKASRELIRRYKEDIEAEKKNPTFP